MQAGFEEWENNTLTTQQLLHVKQSNIVQSYITVSSSLIPLPSLPTQYSIENQYFSPCGLGQDSCGEFIM